MVHRTWFVFAVIAFAVALPASSAGGRSPDQPRTAALASALSNVTRVEFTRREPLAGGLAFGSTGSYEKLVGTAFLEVDPEDPRNSLIVDLDKAPRNARGMVEYSTDLYILKPLDLRKGNGKIFFQVNNRGNKGTLAQFDDGTSANDPSTPADVGNGFVLREGYTLVWAGWEGDILPGANRMTINLPTVTEQGREISGPLTVRFDVARQIPMGGAVSLPLSGRPDVASYETASLDPASATLTVRDYLTTPEQAIPPERWAFATCGRNPRTGEVENVVPSRKDICLRDGFDPDRLYQLSYTARNPKPMALGFAATRDVLSFLRYATADAAGNPNPLGAGISQVYCWGNSQTGRYVRSFVYLGFNADTEGRRVCDGALVQIAAAQQLALNTRFASAEAASQYGALGLYPGDLFPFTYGVTTDPVTGRTDGLLKRPDTDPLVIQLDGENEWFQTYASLVTHDGLGNPLTLPDSVRYYFLSGAQHGSGGRSVQLYCQQPTNPLDYNAFMRMALVALDQWAAGGTPAPPSQYPRADDGTAVRPEVWRDVYPAIPGVTLGVPNSLGVRDYGPGVTAAGGHVTRSPGTDIPGATYAILVPRTDADGNDVAGLRKPDDIQTPLGTHNGWGVRAPGYRAGDLCGLNGQYIPFAATEAERIARGDPRPSLAERYPTHDDYVGRVTAAAFDLQAQRYLLAEDVDRIIAQASDRDVQAFPSRSDPR